MAKTIGFAGRTHTTDARERIRRAHLGKPKSPAHRQKIAEALRGRPKTRPPWNTGRPVPAQERHRISESLRGRRIPEVVRNKISAAQKGKPKSAEHRAAIGRALRESPRNNARREKIRAANIRNWSDPTFARKMFRALWRRPTKPEQRIGRILAEAFPGVWRYVGNGEIVLGRMTPDFLNVNGEKAIIEVFGRYWHKPEDVQYRSAQFLKYGFRTLVIWEDELEETIVKRVRAFCEDVEAFQMICPQCGCRETHPTDSDPTRTCVPNNSRNSMIELRVTHVCDDYRLLKTDKREYEGEIY